MGARERSINPFGDPSGKREKLVRIPKSWPDGITKESLLDLASGLGMPILDALWSDQPNNSISVEVSKLKEVVGGKVKDASICCI